MTSAALVLELQVSHKLSTVRLKESVLVTGFQACECHLHSHSAQRLLVTVSKCVMQACTGRCELALLVERMKVLNPLYSTVSMLMKAMKKLCECLLSH